MKILLASNLTSSKVFDNLFNVTGKNIGFAIQKFCKLIADGFKENGVEVIALSSLPVPLTDKRKNYLKFTDDEENGIVFKYIPFVNIAIIRHVFLFTYSFVFTILWGFKGKKEKAIVCDVLKICVSLGCILASKCIGLRTVGLVTDMPGMYVNRKSHSSSNGLLKSLITRVNKSFMGSFTQYVFLTEQMNNVINRHHRPYIVMEGLVPVDNVQISAIEKYQKKVILYAGGLHERYGLKMLVEGFLIADVPDSELWLYGDGPFVEKLKEYTKNNARVIYKGIRANHEIIDAEQRATLLVNPRPTNEDFTMYSFPSKNMEYMVSGTPLLTTHLPGMPDDYLPYVFLFEDESTDGYSKKLEQVLRKSHRELEKKGKEAREWILTNKNYVKQSNRILSLLKS